MSKYYNPRIGAPTKQKANASKPNAPGGKPKSPNKTGKTGTKAGPPLGKTSPKKKVKTNPNSAPEKAKGGSKADIVKKSKEKNKSTKNVSKPKAPPFLEGPKKVKENKEPKSFNEAFKKARKEKGKDSTFTYKGKSYSTVTMDDVKAAGFDTLKEYLNNKKKK
jgi:hypothetical protein|tara:strand:- start:111 stop:599 length:489 start_codon:yes stop_codon:yes gene_type:complete